MLILQQSRNTTLCIKRQAAQSLTKPIDTPKVTTGHFIALQRKEIQLHPPEHGHKLLYPGNLDKPLFQPQPQGAGSKIKRNHKLPAYSKHSTPLTQQSKQNEKAKKYSTGKGKNIHQTKQKKR